MPTNEFEAIKPNLLFNDRSHKHFDSIHKLRPVLNYLRRRLALILLETKLVVDEQICAINVHYSLNNTIERNSTNGAINYMYYVELMNFQTTWIFTMGIQILLRIQNPTNLV